MSILLVLFFASLTSVAMLLGVTSQPSFNFLLLTNLIVMLPLCIGFILGELINCGGAKTLPNLGSVLAITLGVVSFSSGWSTETLVALLLVKQLGNSELLGICLASCSAAITLATLPAAVLIGVVGVVETVGTWILDSFRMPSKWLLYARTLMLIALVSLLFEEIIVLIMDDIRVPSLLDHGKLLMEHL